MTTETDEPALSELVKNPPETAHVLTTSEEHSTEISLYQIIKCQRFSSLIYLFRVTAYVVRFVSKVKRGLTKETNATAGEIADFEDKRELNSI